MVFLKNYYQIIIILLLTGKTSQTEKEKIYSNIETGKTDIIIGTHALFQEKLKFLDLGFVAMMNNINLEFTKDYY